MNKPEKNLGQHILAEFYECDADILNDVDFLEKTFNEASEAANATIVKSVFHPFSPVGVTGVVVIMESHISIHTWPEFGYAAVDFFTCSDKMQYQKAYDYIANKLKSKNHTSQKVERGFPQHLKETHLMNSIL
ncbi:MAG: adenosylmethionine decarboxylase [Cytophagales bacterium]|nr:adenosylmethionine decarboxylase [Cytophagales bacterium]